jgi:hypothetical protein
MLEFSYTEPTNAARAERARKTMAEYAKICEWPENEPQEEVSAIADLIADLLHLAASNEDEEGMSPNVERIISLAQLHYEAETDEEEDSDDDKTE